MTRLDNGSKPTNVAQRPDCTTGSTTRLSVVSIQNTTRKGWKSGEWTHPATLAPQPATKRPVAHTRGVASRYSDPPWSTSVDASFVERTCEGRKLQEENHIIQSVGLCASIENRCSCHQTGARAVDRHRHRVDEVYRPAHVKTQVESRRRANRRIVVHCFSRFAENYPCPAGEN